MGHECFEKHCREALADSRILTLTPEESISANELRMEHEGALSDSLSAHTQPEQMQPRRPETFPTAKTQPALASQISEVTIPRSYVSSPFGDSSTYQVRTLFKYIILIKDLKTELSMYVCMYYGS